MKGMPTIRDTDMKRKIGDELVRCTDYYTETWPKHFRPENLVEGVGRDGSGEREREQGGKWVGKRERRTKD